MKLLEHIHGFDEVHSFGIDRVVEYIIIPTFLHAQFGYTLKFNHISCLLTFYINVLHKTILYLPNSGQYSGKVTKSRN